MTGCTNLSSEADVKAKIIALEKQALALWNNGNPDGFIELSSDDIIYFDPSFETGPEGKKALEAYYNTIRGKIKIDRYQMIEPIVRVAPDMALLTYDYEAHRDNMVFKMHCTEVYKIDSSGRWKIIHTHWSFVR